MNIKALKEKRLNLINQQKDLYSRAEKEERTLDAAELETFDKIEADLAEIRSNIAAAERMKKNISDLEQRSEDEREKAPAKKEDRAKAYQKAFLQYASRGMKNLNEEQRALLAEYRGTDPQTTTDAEGGYTIPEGFSNQLEQTMALWGGMIDAAQIYRTTTGNAVQWPTVDDTAVSGAILAEASAAVVSDMTFANKTLNAYTYTSNIVKLTVELAQDSAFNLQSFLNDAFARRLGTAMNAHFTTGTGSGQPNGVVTAASVGKTAASGTAITRDEIVDLIHSVDPVYRNGARFMFNDATLAAIKKLSFGSSDDRPLWQAGSIQNGEPSTLEGYAYSINQDMASMAIDAKPIAFGDFSKYIIRLAGQPTMLRLVERYAEFLHVGYIAYQRADGELIQASAIKTLQNAAS